MKLSLLPLAALLLAAPNDISVKIDEPLGLIWHTPRKAPYTDTHEGLFKADTFSWQCYPVIAQTLTHTKKALLMRITISGPGYWYNIRPVITFNVDGEIYESKIPDDGIRSYRNLGLYYGLEITMVKQNDLLERIARADTVWLTIFQASDSNHRSVKLSINQIETVQRTLKYYRELEPRS